jgi:hypothetical protein
MTQQTMPGPGNTPKKAMPSPIGRDAERAENVLQKICYSGHPGKNADCLRGAMAIGGVVCQDCHGDLLQVGNDFTLRRQFDKADDFILDGSLRVPCPGRLVTLLLMLKQIMGCRWQFTSLSPGYLY